MSTGLVSTGPRRQVWAPGGRHGPREASTAPGGTSLLHGDRAASLERGPQESGCGGRRWQRGAAVSLGLHSSHHKVRRSVDSVRCHLSFWPGKRTGGCGQAPHPDLALLRQDTGFLVRRLCGLGIYPFLQTWGLLDCPGALPQVPFLAWHDVCEAPTALLSLLGGKRGLGMLLGMWSVCVGGVS